MIYGMAADTNRICFSIRLRRIYSAGAMALSQGIESRSQSLSLMRSKARSIVGRGIAESTFFENEADWYTDVMM